ncbi:MAG: hydroxymethylbilane synthase [Myxococcales bacterium]
MIRIATRRSALALWQAERVKALLAERGIESSLVPMTTEGDRIVDRPLAEVGGKGLFVKELEQALCEGRADVAVHSAKDVPFALPEGFVLSAFPAREDARDALVAPRSTTLQRLPRGARVGTSSLRRAMQLLAARPDLVIVPVRGNVPTRLARATGGTVMRSGVEVRPAEGEPQGPLDAVVLALAGLRRLGLEQHATEILPVEVSLPAAGQGALAIEAIRGSAGDKAGVQLEDRATALCVRAERAVLTRLAGDCTTPVAAYAVLEGTSLWLRAALGVPGGRVVRAEGRGTDPDALGRAVGGILLGEGGD